jgi:RNA-directed DNA polymerase
MSGLKLSQEKTRITNIDKSFDFLGFNLRKYKGKLLIKPAKIGINTFLVSIRKDIRKAHRADQLISILNPKIQGWANYYRHSVAKKTFTYIDSKIFQATWRWVKKSPPKKPISWIKEKYYAKVNLNQWYFFSPRTKDKDAFYLKMLHKRIVRHVKIKAAATPYDPQFEEYFLDRAKKKFGSRRIARLLQ